MRGAGCKSRSLPRLIDLDIQKFFDSVSWELMLKAVAGQHRSAVGDAVCAAVAAAPVQLPDGTLQQRDRGTPQGSPVSPVLANLFLHYAFDAWMAREFPGVRFERYVDDAVVHCVSERQARQVLAALQDRMVEVGLRLHPDKTKVVYCQDGKRRGASERTSFTFLGFTFRPRERAQERQDVPVVSACGQQGRLDQDGTRGAPWRLHRRTGLYFADLAR